MKTPRSCACLAASACFLTAASTLWSADPPAARGNVLGLPRVDATHASALARAKFSDVSLQPAAGATRQRRKVQHDVAYLALDPGEVWSHTLRGSTGQPTFVSFSANASVDTQFTIGGASVVVQAGSAPGSAVIAVPAINGAPGETAVRVGCSVAAYEGQLLAAVPVLTIRLDPARGVWDLFVGTHLAGAGLPMPSRNEARTITVQAGRNGAQLCGVVLSDDNPLFLDANANGIEDTFEVARAGKLLSARSSAKSQQAVLKAWRATQGPGTTRLIFGRRPAPDEGLRVTGQRNGS